MTLSKFFFYVCLSFIIGIFFASQFDFFLILIFLIIVFSLISIFILNRYKKIFLLGIFILFFVFGIFRYNIAENNFLIGEEIEIKGIINIEPKETEKVKILKVNNITIITEKYSDYNYGDRIIAKGFFNDSFSLFFPEIEKIEEGEDIFFKKLFLFKDNLREKINKNFNYNEARILSAMTMGDKHKMSNELKEKLNISGTRHITAISGMHIALIGIFLNLFLLFLGFSRNFSFYFSIIFLFLYILMIGLPPSAIRAFIMGGVYMFSQKIGRNNNNTRNIFLTAGIMLILNPSLIYDYGFNLSFLAVFGIIQFFPILEKNISLFKNKKRLRELFLIALSAYIFTFPFLLYNFSQVSLISVFSNVLIVPLVYLIMIFGFLFLIFGTIFPFISFIFIIPLWFFLSLFLFFINLFSKFPYLKIENVHIIFPIIIYFFLFYIIYLFNKNKNYANI